MRRLAFSRLLLLLIAIPVLGLDPACRPVQLRKLDALHGAGESGFAPSTRRRRRPLRSAGPARARARLRADSSPTATKPSFKPVAANTDRLYGSLKEAASKNAIADAAISANLKNIDERFQNQLQAFRRRVDDKTAQVAEVTAVLQPIAGAAYDLIGRAGADRRRRGSVATHLRTLFRAAVRRRRVHAAWPDPDRRCSRDSCRRRPFLVFGKGLTLQASFKKMFIDLASADMIAKYNAFHATTARRWRRSRRSCRGQCRQARRRGDDAALERNQPAR